MSFRSLTPEIETLYELKGTGPFTTADLPASLRPKINSWISNSVIQRTHPKTHKHPATYVISNIYLTHLKMNELLNDPETVHHIRTGKTSYSELRALTGLSYSTIYRKVKNVIPEPLEIAQ